MSDWERWLTTARDWVHAVERAYVAAAFGPPAAPGPAVLPSPAASHASAVLAAAPATPAAHDDPAAAVLAAVPATQDDPTAAVLAAVHATQADPAAAVLAAVAAAAAGAVASHFLAVASPRSIGLIGDPAAAALSLAAHRVWFQPADLRCAGPDLAAQLGGRAVSLDEALAADIVCVHAPLSLAAARLRRATHVNALAAVTLDDELRALATLADEPAGLSALAAGLRDGRKLDELTIFLAGDLAIARRALAALR